MRIVEFCSLMNRHKLFAIAIFASLAVSLFGLFGRSPNKTMKAEEEVANLRNGVYEFHLGSSLFVVPQNYVRGYGRNSTDGLLYHFTLHAKLPEFSGYTPADAEVFKNFLNKGRIEITVHADRRTRVQSERYWYDMAYTATAKIIGVDLMRGDSLAPKIHEMQQKADSYGVVQKYIFVVGDGVVLKDLRCDGLCRITIVYKDHINIYAVFDERYKGEWLGISDKIIGLLSSFEKSDNGAALSSLH